jgi:Zn finger protein HypA/HybF involved in hydrogenase expression
MGYKFTDNDRLKSIEIKSKQSAEKVFQEGSHAPGKHLAKLMRSVAKREYSCALCGITEWQNKPIVLQVDHINGVHYDNRLENLRFLCPNCHSQTDTFCGAGNTGSHKVTDEELIDAIKSSKNIRRALMKVGLTPKGGNYVRVQELVAKHNLKFNSVENKRTHRTSPIRSSDI